MSISGKNVLVTGAGGFIGSHLTELLVKKGASVRAFCHYNALGNWGWLDASPAKKDVEVILGDISDRDSIRNAVRDINVVLHLAALIGIPYSYQAPYSYVQTNIIGTLNVLQSALEEEVDCVIHTSTSETYGSAHYVPIDESHPLQGQSPYSATKIGADKLAESFHRSFSLPVVTIRPFNTYGPRQSARAVIPTIIIQALNADTIHLGNLSPTRDLTFVLDTAEGFIAAAEHPEAIGQVINLGTGNEISMKRLAEKILRLMGVDLGIESDQQRIRPDTSEVDRLCADNTKAKALLGWTPSYALDEGLLETISWVKENIDQYHPKRYAV